MRFFRFDELQLTPWKNGGGTTRELLCFPEGAGLDEFDYRISLATISRDGPFSAFPGIDRTLALVEGDGVTLVLDGDRKVVVNEDTPVYQFAGETPVHALVNAGTTMDFNVMTRRGRCRHSFRVHYGTLAGFTCEGDLTLFFALHLPPGRTPAGRLEDMDWLGSYDAIAASTGETVTVDALAACLYIVEITLEGDGA